MNMPDGIHGGGVVAPVGIKARIKQALRAQPRLWSLYWRTKQQIRRVLLLRFFLYDIGHTYRAMFWHEANIDRVSLAAELLFQYHKIEKGLVMPGPRRLFGVEPVTATMDLCRRWISAAYPRTDPVFVGAVEAVAAFARRVQENALDPTGKILPQVVQFLTAVPERDVALQTPRLLPGLSPDGRGDAVTGFAALALARRSVREFRPMAVPAEILREAARAAQLAPSACNRQPCRLTIISAEEQKRKLLAHQNGNRGFGHLAPHVAILTADERCFFDASERHEPYIDGGLFAMNFILSLRDQGVGSCCLNWCVPPATDRAVHHLFAIPQSQRVIMLIAIGYEPVECMVPQSPRRAVEDVIRFV